ncbi:hypothetical protein SDRG_14457 [Saprolegnia diclina VS20]|uniref:DUF4246 domain-containing protein n=1 Tax=Saprolegnia diclina (strain VS20) TaxID=1156394 RepID=T0R6L3_SAPDV|nr:hypothetical protein SDRG_14457 [Saprolegnia diclina VS20]EQC27703.1 hypothetical protein SDRG_14457 [Saprolegnia diclina VS20]|eukprot:XP_008618808.1 hypothetical protein SDRG_14457 [Saprolegnia diclina VS20]
MDSTNDEEAQQERKHAVQTWLNDAGAKVPDTLDVSGALDDSGATALHLAVAHGSLSGLRLLAARLPSVDLLDDNAWTPLYTAIMQKNQAAALTLLELGASPNGSTHESPCPLYAACYHGLHDVIVRLVAAGADVLYTMEDKSTPLTALNALDDDIDIAAMATVLLHAGALTASNAKHAVFWFAPNIDRIRLLVPFGLRAEDIDAELLVLDLPLLQLYIELGGNPNAVCYAYSANVPLLTCLLQKGDQTGARFLAPYANVNYVDEAGFSGNVCALRAAIATFPEPLTIEVLLTYGSDMPQEFYNDALALAIGDDCVQLESLERIASKANMTSKPFLAYAVRDAERVALLLRLGADPNQHNENGVSPLYLACLGEYAESVRLLVPVTLDAISERHNGKSALDVALPNLQRAIAVTLLRAGFPAPPKLSIEDLYFHPALPKTYVWSLWHASYEGFTAYSRLELQYMMALSSALDDPTSPRPTTGLTRDGLALLRAEVNFRKSQELFGMTATTTRGVFFLDDPKIAAVHATLMHQLAPLEATAQWDGPRLDVVDPALYGVVYDRTLYYVTQHGGRLGVPTAKAPSSRVDQSEWSSVTCDLEQFLPTPVTWDALTGRATLDSYLNNIPVSMKALYETLSDSLSLVLPLVNHAETFHVEDSRPRIRLSKKAASHATVKAAVVPELPRAKGFKFQPISTRSVFGPPSRRQVYCGVQGYRATTAPTVTPWQRTTGAVNEGVSRTALVFYDVRNVVVRVELAETFAYARTCPSLNDPAIEVHCPNRDVVQTQVTGHVTAHASRVLILQCAAAYRFVLTPVDASGPGHCKVLTWHCVSPDVDALLSTAEVFPQQKAQFLDDTVHGTRLATLPDAVLDLVLSFFGRLFLDDVQARDIASVSKQKRAAMVRRSMGALPTDGTA